MFSLSFDVIDRPPTNVACSVDGSLLSTSDYELIRTVTKAEDPIEVQVTVLFRRRLAGQYQCSVTTDKITVTGETAVFTPIRDITGKYTHFGFVL